MIITISTEPERSADAVVSESEMDEIISMLQAWGSDIDDRVVNTDDTEAE